MRWYVSVVPGREGESDVAAEGKKWGFEGGVGGVDEVVSGGVPAGVVPEVGVDVVAVGGGVGAGVGENRLVRGSLALDLYRGPKELSMDK